MKGATAGWAARATMIPTPTAASRIGIIHHRRVRHRKDEQAVHHTQAVGSRFARSACFPPWLRIFRATGGQERTDRERVHAARKKRRHGVGGRLDDRLTLQIEGSIERRGNSRAAAHGLREAVEQRALLRIDRLHARASIHVRDGGEKIAPVRARLRRREHEAIRVRRGQARKIEPLGRGAGADRRRKRAI